MEKNHLRDILSDLRRELDGTDHIDDSTREQIAGVVEELHQLIDQSSDSPSDHHLLPMQQLRDIIVRLETSHPRLTSTIERVCDMLSSIGI